MFKVLDDLVRFNLHETFTYHGRIRATFRELSKCRRLYVPGEWVSALRDGVVLCELCNKLRPGIVPHINRSTKVRAPLSTPNSLLIFNNFELPFVLEMLSKCSRKCSRKTFGSMVSMRYSRRTFGSMSRKSVNLASHSAFN